MNSAFHLKENNQQKQPSRSSQSSEAAAVQGVLKICIRFTGEHPCRSAISIKLHSSIIEMVLRHGCSPVNLLHIFRTPFRRNTSGWLLLNQYRLRNVYYLRSWEKTFHKFLQNKNQEMETRSSMLALQEIYATYWFCLKVTFLSIVNPPCEQAYSEPIQTSRMELSAYTDNGVNGFWTHLWYFWNSLLSPRYVKRPTRNLARRLGWWFLRE